MFTIYRDNDDVCKLHFLATVSTLTIIQVLIKITMIATVLKQGMMMSFSDIDDTNGENNIENSDIIFVMLLVLIVWY